MCRCLSFGSMGVRELIILVPKIIARRDMAYDADEYYRNHVLWYLQAEHLDAGTALVHVLKNGRRVVYKKDLKEQYPYSKDFRMGATPAENTPTYLSGIRRPSPRASQ